ncbi:MAG: hypothetical protein IJP34_04220 [Clostridia bacterium]|nr:hypothetical protein [Clostridia bacterium]
MVTLKTVESYKDYGKCVEISNGIISALVTVEIGPRIIKFGFVGGQNFMCDDRAGLGGMDMDKPYTDLFGEGKHWENLGGHRIWSSPESYPETYTPDDSPVEYTETENGAIFTQVPYKEVGIQSQMEIIMAENSSELEIKMSVQNIADTPREYSVWALSVCAQNGTIILPMNTIDTGLLPNRIVSIWPYTDMSNDRIYWGKKYLTVTQKPTCDGPMKLGLDLNCGKAYYLLNGEVFKKEYKTNHLQGKYPDGGCSFETYTNDCMLEFETLSELKVVNPGESNTLNEKWTLSKIDFDVDVKNDASIDNLIEKL